MNGPEYRIPIDIPGILFYKDPVPFQLEKGGVLEDGITIAYHTYGTLNENRDNVIWVCHALTANSNVADWWSGLFGEGKIMDPSKYFIVCANVLGSCYGSTGPRSINPKSGSPYGMRWPLVTVRDWVKAQERLRLHLGIEKIHLCIGGSCGGHQVLEFAMLIPDQINHLGLIATSVRETAWAIAGHEAQRLAMEADPTLYENDNDSGSKGLQAARAIALLGYRTIEAYIETQTDEDDTVDNLKASSYARYQGEKLSSRFYAHCYYHLTKTLDTHHIGRGRGTISEILKSIKIPATILGIYSDRSIPITQQEILVRDMPNAKLHGVHSLYGHDGFLIETDQITNIFRQVV
ncbi:MAG TPA: homoserine O-acetyltransferase [Saprospiraceae bacterium]|nr:homoserine O-acetyltransferase [Saprospiraceae bacterium]